MQKPKRGFNWLSDIIKKSTSQFQIDDKVILIGVRGYFLNSMGVPNKNDRGIYDDAFFWVELPSGVVHQFNGNVDPSSYRKGSGKGSAKGMASLQNGVWRYKPGVHNGSVPHDAFRQADDVIVTRDGNPPYEDEGMFGINIHRGGNKGTSSLGCQTVPPAQWDDFKETGYKLLKKAAQKTFPYILTELQG